MPLPKADCQTNPTATHDGPAAAPLSHVPFKLA
jgi:hypothetical protein